MQEALLLVFLIAILTLFLVHIYTKQEGFFDSSSSTAAQAAYVTSQQSQYGNIGLSLLTAGNVGALGSSATPQTTTVKSGVAHPLDTEPTGLFANIQTCEAIQTMDCSAFDNPEFSLNCGICLDVGTNSAGASIPGGGLVVLDEDKQVARQTQTSNFLTKYVPTVGFCPAGKLVTTKEECLKLQRQLQCQKNQSFDLPGCAQCYSDGSYSIVDPSTNPGVVVGSGTISLVGNGKLTISEQGFAPISNIALSPTTPYSYSIQGREGNSIGFVVTAAANSATAIYIAGYVSGDTFKGEFDMDLRGITLTDNVTGRKPRAFGSMTVDSNPVTKMAPGFGEKTMSLVATVPFSFVDTTTQEAYLCQNGPFVTKASSVQILQSDPCYAKGSGPGNYSLDCLQNIWLSNGCTQSGKYYPADSSSASLLMSNPDGSFRTSNDIANLVYTQALVSSTGIDSTGKSANLQTWSDASLFCTGTPITNPCEGPTKTSGPLSGECITYLWKNMGADTTIGPTYPSVVGGSSLFTSSTIPQFCQVGGTLSPVDTNGNLVSSVVEWWQTQGGVDSVKKIMSNLYVAANTEGSPDNVRMPFFAQCYGPLALAAQPVAPPPPPPKVYTCPSPTTKLVSRPFIPKQNTILATNVQVFSDYTFAMNITPKGPVDGWASIFHMTTGQDSGPFGSRALAIWFYPGSTNKLAVHIDHSTQPGWAARVSDQAGLTVPFVIGKTSLFVITCNRSDITITVDGKTYGSFTHDGQRYRGKVTLYGSNPWWPASNCSVENICYGSIPYSSPSPIITQDQLSSGMILVGGPGGMRYSNDGTTWAPCGQNVFPSSLASKVEFIAKVFTGRTSYYLAGGSSSSGARLAVSEDGITWREVNSFNNYGGPSSSFNSLIYTGNSYIMLCTNVSKNYAREIFYSYDGSWSQMQVGDTPYVSQITKGNSVLVAVCAGVNMNFQKDQHGIYYSRDDGNSWTAASSIDSFFTGGNLECVGFNGRHFVAGGCTGAGGGPPILLYSSDGISWNRATAPGGINGRIFAIANNGNAWLGAAQYDGLVYSTDSVNWTRCYNSELGYATSGINSIRWYKNAWYVTVTEGLITSRDGINWSRVSSVPSGIVCIG